MKNLLIILTFFSLALAGSGLSAQEQQGYNQLDKEFHHLITLLNQIDISIQGKTL